MLSVKKRKIVSATVGQGKRKTEAKAAASVFVSEQTRPGSDCSDAKADQGLRCSHLNFKAA